MTHRIPRQFPVRPLAFLVTGLILLAACGESGPCTTSVEPGIIVEVLEAGTNLPAADGATGLITERLYTETLRQDGPGALAGADERPGTYALTVSKLGYGTFDTTGVEVKSGSCHVRTVTVQVFLQPA